MLLRLRRSFAASLLFLTLADFSFAQKSPAAAATPASEIPPVSLEECVARALDRNFDLKIQHFESVTAKDELEIAKGAFDPNVQVSATESYTRNPPAQRLSIDPDGNPIVTSSQSKQTTTDVRGGVTQTLPTGTVVSATSTLDRNKNTPTSSTPNPVYTDDVVLSVRQPILRGFGTAYNRAEIERAKLGITRANYDFKSAVLTVVRNVESAYYNVAFARQQLAVYRFSLDVAQRLLDENDAKKNTGVATDLDVLQAQVGVATARRNVVLGEQALHDREDALLALINPFQFSTTIGQVTLPDDPAPQLSFDHSYKLARDNSPDYASALASIEQFKIDARVAKSNQLPSLDVGATGGLNSREASYGRSTSRVWNGNAYDWQVDATLSFPWGFRADRARYRQALTSVNRQQAMLEQLDQNIMVQVRGAIRSVEANQESVRISQVATEFSQKEFDLEKARYDAGVSTFRRVQEAQADLDNAQVSELQAKVALRNALADLARLEGTSLTRYKIKLEQ